MVHNMNTRPAMRAGLTNAQATIQTLLLIFVSFIAVWLRGQQRLKLWRSDCKYTLV